MFNNYAIINKMQYIVSGIIIGFVFSWYFERNSANKKEKKNELVRNESDQLDLDDLVTREYFDLEIGKIYQSLRSIRMLLIERKYSDRNLSEIEVIGSEKIDNGCLDVERNHFDLDKCDIEDENQSNETIDQEQFFDTSEIWQHFDSNPNMNCENGSKINFTTIDSMIEIGADRTRLEEIYDYLEELSKKNPNDADLFWRMAKVTHLLSKKFDKFLDLNGERRKSLLFKSYNYASEALKLDEKNFNCHKWFAISIGCISEFVSLKDKISNALKFHHHLEKALVMNKNDPILHYLFGRFCLEILSVSWAERRIVKTFFGGTLPSVSYELALDYFERAYDLKPKWKENLIFLCKTLLQIKQNHRAKQYFEEANSIPDDEIDDETIKDEFKSLKNLLEK